MGTGMWAAKFRLGRVSPKVEKGAPGPDVVGWKHAMLSQTVCPTKADRW